MFMTMFVTPCHESFSHRVTKTLRESFFSSPCLCASVAIFFHGKDHKEELFISFVVHGFLLFAGCSNGSPFFYNAFEGRYFIFRNWQ